MHLNEMEWQVMSRLGLMGLPPLRTRSVPDYIPIRISIPAINARAAISAGGNGRAIIPANPLRISQIANSSIPALRVIRTAIVYLRELAFRRWEMVLHRLPQNAQPPG